MNLSLLGSALFGIASATTWGAGDFCGGLATRKHSAWIVVFYSQAIGLVLLVFLALLSGERLPTPIDVVWGALAGIAGVIGVGVFYTALSRGNMGLVAPVTGVISTAMPVVFGALAQGLPHPLQLAGFGVAIVAVALISRSGEGRGTNGLQLAIIAGVAFGAFLVLIAQTQDNSVFWPLSAARGASVFALLVLLIARRSLAPPPRNVLPQLLGSGVLDAAGNFLYVLAAQAGRIDVAGALSSMYPASTVILALVLLHERLQRWQIVGVVLSLAAIPLIVAA